MEGGTLFASSTYNQYAVGNLMNDSGAWYAAKDASSAYVQYEFPSKVIINSMYLKAVGNLATNFTVSVSEDGVNFNNVGSYKIATAAGEWLEYFSNILCLKIKITISGYNDTTNGNYIGLGRWKIYGRQYT